MPNELFLGLDLGTGGARCIAVTAGGEVVASAAVDLPADASMVAEGRHEQQPEAWWRAAVDALGKTAAGIRQGGRSIDSVRGMAIDGTSGTIVPVDADLQPLGPALMYNDGRATSEATRLNDEQAEFCTKLGYRFASSFAAAKILWLTENEPQQVATARWFAHQGDFVAWRLTGQGGTTDYSNALKTGYDLIDDRWPGWMEQYPGISERLPAVVAPGTVIGKLQRSVAEQVGLPAGIKIVAGCTDGTAGVLASGAREIGDDNTTLGTTLVFKRVAAEPAKDARGLVYSHKLPGGRWLPGAASNVGGGWIREGFANADLRELDQQAVEHLPSGSLAYPLTKRGERFPFLSDAIEAFIDPPQETAAQRYAAMLQGTALVERLAYEALDETTGGATRGDVYATGGGSRSDVWMQLRADVSRRTLHRPACSEAAFGSAVLAVAGTLGGDVWQASRQMVRVDRTFEPQPATQAAYDEIFARFKQKLSSSGYIEK